MILKGSDAPYAQVTTALNVFKVSVAFCPVKNAGKGNIHTTVFGVAPGGVHWGIEFGDPNTTGKVVVEKILLEADMTNIL